MRFIAREGFVLFSGDRPGNHATLFGPDGQALKYRDDMSSFDDAGKAYTWGFEHGGELVDGDRFVFAVADWEAVGRARGGVVEVVEERASVHRMEGGKPFGVAMAEETADGERLRRKLAEEGLLKPGEVDAALREAREVRERYETVVLPRSCRTSSARILAIFPGVQSPGAGWNTLNHASANNESAYMAHGMSYVSSYLKSRGHQVWLLDTRGCQNWQHFIDEVRKQDYDYAMLGPLSIEAFTAACIVRILKEAHPDKPVIVGGLHVSMTKDKAFPPDDLPHFYFYGEPPSRMREYLSLKGEGAFDPGRWPKADYCVWNEGELATAAIVEGEDLKAGGWDYEETKYGTVFMNGKIVPDLNKMPHMDRNLFNEDLEKQHPLLPELPAPFHTITFGRGCPYKCSYCSVGVQFSSSKVRLIEPDYFMEELHALKRSNGGHIGSLMIHDDILLFPSWLEDWNEKIKQQFGHIVYWCQMRADFIVNHPALVRHMAEAGMVWVSVGYESGHARGLNGIMNKGLKVVGIDDPVEINLRAAEILRSIGVNSFGNFMLGNPQETNEEMDATVRMIQKIQPQHQGFSTYADFPGTPMSDLITREGLRMNEWYARSHYPWQYRLKGVDYDHVNKCYQIAAQTPRTYLNPPRAGIAWKNS